MKDMTSDGHDVLAKFADFFIKDIPILEDGASALLRLFLTKNGRMRSFPNSSSDRITLVEARGVEPLSEAMSKGTSPGAARDEVSSDGRSRADVPTESV